MIVMCDPGSEAWHGLRYGKISATRMSNILGFGYDSPYRTWEVMVGARPEASATAAMQHGKDSEAYAADEFSYRFGEPVAETGVVVHDRLPFLSASPDRLVGKDAILEIKCPYRNGIPQLPGDVNPGYMAQMLLQFACLDDRDVGYLLTYVAEGMPVVRNGALAGQGGAGLAYRVERNVELEKVALGFAGEWYYNHVIRGAPPERKREFPIQASDLLSMVKEEVLRW